MTGAGHGTGSCYADGCRCDPCRAGWAAYMAGYRHRERDPVTLRHGEYTTYRNYSCRCLLCTEAQRTEMAAYKVRRRAAVS